MTAGSAKLIMHKQVPAPRGNKAAKQPQRFINGNSADHVDVLKHGAPVGRWRFTKIEILATTFALAWVLLCCMTLGPAILSQYAATNTDTTATTTTVRYHVIGGSGRSSIPATSGVITSTVSSSSDGTTLAGQGDNISSSSSSSATVMFALIARNSAGVLPHSLHNIQRLAQQFAKSYVLLIENDSEDNTVAVFESWLQRTKQEHLSISGEVRSYTWNAVPYRDLKVYARARNEYLKAVNEPQYWDADLVIAVDTDMCVPWDVEQMTSVINSLMFPQQQQHRPPMDAIYAYGACGWFRRPYKFSRMVPPYTPGAYARYCDLFALQDTAGKRYVTKTGPDYHYQVNAAWREALVPTESWLWQTEITPESYCKSSDMQAQGCTVVNGEPVVPVQSAFGGLAIFRASLFRSDVTKTPDSAPFGFWKSAGGSGNGGSTTQPCVYDSDGDQCEHVPLGVCLHERGYKQAIAMRLVVSWERDACSGPVRDALPAYADMKHWGKAYTSCPCRGG